MNLMIQDHHQWLHFVSHSRYLGIKPFCRGKDQSVSIQPGLYPCPFFFVIKLMFICAPRRCLKFLRNCSLLPDDQVSVLASIFMPTYKQVFQCSPYSFSLTTFSNPQPSCTFSILIKLQQQRGSEQPDLQRGGGPDLQEITESQNHLGCLVPELHRCTRL